MRGKIILAIVFLAAVGFSRAEENAAPKVVVSEQKEADTAVEETPEKEDLAEEEDDLAVQENDVAEEDTDLSDEEPEESDAVAQKSDAWWHHRRRRRRRRRRRWVRRRRRWVRRRRRYVRRRRSWARRRRAGYGGHTTWYHYYWTLPKKYNPYNFYYKK